MKTHWLRLYTEVLYDPKVLRLPAETFRTWVLLLCAVKESGTADGELPDASDTAYLLHMSDEEYAGHITMLESRGLIEDGRIHAWATRQFQTDDGDQTNAERQRRYREKRKPVTVTDDAPVTVTDESVTVTRYVTDEASVTVTAQSSENREQRTEITHTDARACAITSTPVLQEPQAQEPAPQPSVPAPAPVPVVLPAMHESAEIAVEYYKHLAKAGGILKMPQSHDYKTARVLSDALGGLERARPLVAAALERYFGHYAELWFARKGQAPPFTPDWSFSGFCRHFDEILGPQAARSAWRDDPTIKRMLEEMQS